MCDWCDNVARVENVFTLCIISNEFCALNLCSPCFKTNFHITNDRICGTYLICA